MNVSDKWMLEQMQQMAASMATTLPQTGQNSQPAKTDKGESFKDLMDKAAKDQKTEVPKKEDAPAKQQETVQDGKPVQKTEQAQQPQPAKNTAKVKLDVETAALVAAGYAEVMEVFEDGSALIMLSEEFMNGGVAIVYDGSDIPTGVEELIPVMITNAAGEEVTVTPEQIREVFDSLGMEVPRKDSGDNITVVGQLDMSKYQDAEVITPDGKLTTLKDALQQVRVKDNADGEASQEEDDANLDAEVMTASEPLFKDVKAAPVKVGENFQLDTQEPDMEQKLADTIRFAAQQDLRQIEIKLSPENLGSLTIKLTQAGDGTLQVVLHTANAKAASLLSQHLDNLNAALQGYGSGSEVKVEVQRNDNSQQAGQEQQHQQTDPDGHNKQQYQQQQHRQDGRHSGDFVQRLRLGLFDAGENM